MTSIGPFIGRWDSLDPYEGPTCPLCGSYDVETRPWDRRRRVIVSCNDCEFGEEGDEPEPDFEGILEDMRGYY